MLEKLLLAITITFCLNLFLGVRLPSTADNPNYRLAETATPIQKIVTPSLQPMFTVPR